MQCLLTDLAAALQEESSDGGAACVRRVATTPQMRPAVLELMTSFATHHQRAAGDDAAWRPFALFGADHYVRNCVLRTEAFELLVLCWAPGQESRIHDHATSSWCAL